jgi:predicted dehydrogenase
MEQGRCRLGLIGAGNVVETYHLPVLRSLRNVEMSWVCDRDLDRARSLARTFGIPEIYKSVEECSDVEVVLVGIPVGARRSVLNIVTSRGWSALCEKPFAPTLADHKAIVEQARHYGVQLGIGLQRRQYSTTQVARQLIEAKLLGKPQQIIAGEGTCVRRTGRDSDWYQGSAQASGGTLYETGSHLVDQVFTICGATNYRIERCRQDGWNGLELETSVTGIVNLESSAEVPFAFVVSRMHDVYNGIVVRCQNGEIRVALSPERPIEICSYNNAVPITIAFPNPAVNNMSLAMAAEWTHFLDKRNKSQPFSDWDTGLLVSAFVEDCFRVAIKSHSLVAEVYR